MSVRETVERRAYREESSGTGGGSNNDRGGYTTIKTYRIPRDEPREEAPKRTSTTTRETRVVRRERDPSPEPSPSPPRRDRDIRIERIVRSPPPRDDDMQLGRYIRTTEYYPPRAPEREREREREEDFQVVRRSEVYDDDRKQVVVRKQEQEDDDDYYYVRRTREVEEKSASPSPSPERKPRRRRHRHKADDYSSSEDEVVIKREVRETSSGSDSGHRRHLAEGAIAAVGAAELIRHHRSKSGSEHGSRAGRLGRDLAAGAVGVAGAEAVSRVRSRHREKEREREREVTRDQGSNRGSGGGGGGDEDRDRRSRKEKKSENRSRSRSRLKQAAGIGLGVVALAAAAGYAKHKQNQNQNRDDRDGRSHRRRHSVGADEAAGDRNTRGRAALAGLAGAAAAGLVERHRSKSRQRDGRQRSHSRIRTGIPIVAAGLGSAALAGLVGHKNTAKEINQAEGQQRARDRHDRNNRRSRSRNRAMYDAPGASGSTPGLIEYGDGPVYTGQVDAYGRPLEEGAMVPAGPGVAGAGAGYNAAREYSDESDDDRRHRRHRRHRQSDASRSRSRSRVREMAAAGLAAAGAAVGAHKFAERQRNKKDQMERDRLSDNAYDPNPQYPASYQPPPLSPQPGAPPPAVEPAYPSVDQYYPHTQQFAPPPVPVGNNPYAPSPPPPQAAAAYPEHPGTYGTPDYTAHNAAQQQQHHQQYYEPPPQQHQTPYGDPAAASYPSPNSYPNPRGDENVSVSGPDSPLQRGFAPDARAAEEGLIASPPPPAPTVPQPRHESQGPRTPFSDTATTSPNPLPSIATRFDNGAASSPSLGPQANNSSNVPQYPSVPQPSSLPAVHGVPGVDAASPTASTNYSQKYSRAAAARGLANITLASHQFPQRPRSQPPPGGPSIASLDHVAASNGGNPPPSSKSVSFAGLPADSDADANAQQQQAYLSDQRRRRSRNAYSDDDRSSGDDTQRRRRGHHRRHSSSQKSSTQGFAGDFASNAFGGNAAADAPPTGSGGRRGHRQRGEFRPSPDARRDKSGGYASDDTIELPTRYGRDGHPSGSKDVDGDSHGGGGGGGGGFDAVSDRIEEFLSGGGSGGVGKLFKGLAGDIFDL